MKERLSFRTIMGLFLIVVIAAGIATAGVKVPLEKVPKGQTPSPP